MHSLRQGFGQVMAVEDVVSKHQGTMRAGDKFLCNQEGLCNTFRPGLGGIVQSEAKTRSVAEEMLELGDVLRSRDNQYVSNAGQHES